MQVRLVHEFRFEAAHKLPRVPQGHKCARLHGHSFKIEVAIASDQVDKTIDAITSAAKTGQIGDGKIFVINLDHAVRIRTGEADAAAL